MKPNPYIRYLDLIVILLSVDILRFLLLSGLSAAFGSELDGSVATTVLLLCAIIFFWTKVGLAILFWKNVPFRNSNKNSVAFKKIWVMAFFWPLVLKK